MMQPINCTWRLPTLIAPPRDDDSDVKEINSASDDDNPSKGNLNPSIWNSREIQSNNCEL